jgi:hypothetical protein
MYHRLVVECKPRPVAAWAISLSKLAAQTLPFPVRSAGSFRIRGG